MQVDDVIILIERHIIKFVYQIKDFVRFDYGFADFVKSFIGEVINYITARYFKSIDFVIKATVDERKVIARLSSFESTLYFLID